MFFFLKEVGADMPMDWNIEALDRIRNGVIEAFGKIGVTLEIDDRLQSTTAPYLNKREVELECITEETPLRLK